MHPYWITVSGHLGVGVTARSEADALQLFSLAFGSVQKVVSIEMIKNMDDLDQNHVIPNLGWATGFVVASGFPKATSTFQAETRPAPKERCLN
ncbi:hypothetical protein CK216_04590 [Mesorhizobium sp. WSM3876]|nr:hypothetical protein CK216_04590 [Mesorhizobium sp. WSM3876]